MRISFAAVLLLALPLAAAAADNSPIGRWKTLDDETGKVMTIAEIYQAQNGKLAAKIVEAVDPAAAICSKCDGAKKGKSTVGMPILWNLSPIEGGWVESGWLSCRSYLPGARAVVHTEVFPGRSGTLLANGACIRNLLGRREW